MAKQPKWTDKEYEYLIDALDKHIPLSKISTILNRSIKGIGYVISVKLKYKPMCLDCSKRFIRKGNRLRCVECSIKRNKRRKQEYSKEMAKYFTNIKSESRFGGNRQKCLERDHYTCRECGKTHHEIMLDVHHKDKTGRNKKEHNHDIDNLITLCHSCHTKYHKEDTIMKRWRKQGREGIKA